METIKKGTYIYIYLSSGVKLLRKITYLCGEIFEYKGGWGKINQLKLNEDLKSTIKYEFNNF